MSIESTFGNFFKPQTKSSGAKLVAQEKVSLTLGTDTSVQAYIQATPPVRVVFSSARIESDTFTASCNCPAGKKASFCKHVWATLLLAETRAPDFLSAKRNIEKAATTGDEGTAKKESYVEAAKARAREYRKAEYRKQKARVKPQKEERTSKLTKAHSPEVEAALAYFELNGFPMGPRIDEAALGEAKRKLSRIFHPDKGGSHAESVELNHHWTVLLQHSRR